LDSTLIDRLAVKAVIELKNSEDLHDGYNLQKTSMMGSTLTNTHNRAVTGLHADTHCMRHVPKIS